MTVLPPLHGIRVVDFTDSRAEIAARVLAELGADVIRVEPLGGSRSRQRGPFLGGISLHHLVRNTFKRQARFDLADPSHRARLDRLVAHADILFVTPDDTTPDDTTRHRYDLTGLSSEHPGLVVVTISDFGSNGPYCDYVATDDVMVALSWMLFRSGTLDRPPLLPPGSFASDIAGVSTAFAALTALTRRIATGIGSHVDLSLIEAVQQTTDWGLANSSVINRASAGSYRQVRAGGGQVYPVIQCLDGWVRPATVTRAEWRRMRAWLGEPDVLQDDHWDSSAARVDIYDDVLRPLYEQHFATLTMTDAAEEGQRRGIPVTPVLRPKDVLQTGQYKALGAFTEVGLTGGATATVPTGFYHFDGERLAKPGAHEPSAEGAIGWIGPRNSEARSRTDGRKGQPYEGVRVLDFGVAGAAPEIARLLAEYGADVVRVETPHHPDPFRTIGHGDGISPLFVSSNRGKRSFGVDLATDRGRRLVLSLIEQADVLVENLAPGRMSGLGLGWDTVHATNPHLLMISSHTMGSTGPWATWKGYGANTQPPTGLTYLWSFPDADAPVASNVAFPDHVVGRLGATAAAAWLLTTSPRQGRHVEIPQSEVAINFIGELLAHEANAPGSTTPAGNRSPEGAPWGVYRCAGQERWCVITCRDDADWRALRRALGDPSWAADPRLDDAEGRHQLHDLLDEHLTEWTTARSDRSVMETLQEAGVPAGMMMYVGDVPDDPHLRARGYVVALDHPGIGPMLVEGPAFHADEVRPVIDAHAPMLGEHTRAVAADWLGLNDEQIAGLFDDGTLHEP